MLHRFKDISGLILSNEPGPERIQVEGGNNSVGGKGRKSIMERRGPQIKVREKWVAAHKAKDTTLLYSIDKSCSQIRWLSQDQTQSEISTTRIKAIDILIS